MVMIKKTIIINVLIISTDSHFTTAETSKNVAYEACWHICLKINKQEKAARSLVEHANQLMETWPHHILYSPLSCSPGGRL